uniref:Ionotropic glutamate receptor C-terminal domain-containing protein n=1 Tax=Anopheles culicifacies TaxID=139723 RepID=A0A182MT78_9DIPT
MREAAKPTPNAQTTTRRSVEQLGIYIKQSANCDWGAKYLFYLPSVDAQQLANFTAIATLLTGQRLYNNLFAINHEHLITYNVLNSSTRQHNRIEAAVNALFQDKFLQMHRYYLEDVIDHDIYPFHFVIYGKMKIFTREAHFITMLADRLNISMVEREDHLNFVLKDQFQQRLKDNSIIATFGHTLGDFRRIYTNDMEGICALTPAASMLSIIDDFIDPFDVYIWILWFVCSELTALAWTIVMWADSSEPRTMPDLFRHYAGLHFVLLQCCVLAPPELKKLRFIQQLLMFCYILAVFNIVTVYISVVTSNLSITRYGKGLNTIQDLIDRQTPMIGPETHLQVLRLGRQDLNIYGKTNEKSYAAVLTCSYAQLAMKHSPNVYRIIDEPLVAHYIVYLLHKESILQDVLERYVALTYQANLYQYWDNFILQKVPIQKTYQTLAADVIKFEEIIWLFIILPIGACCGVVVFLLEIIYFRSSKWRSNWNETNTNTCEES